MKTIDIFGAVIFAGLIGALSFMSGEYYAFYTTKPLAIQYRCAYYDQATGDYTWGVPPQVVQYPPLMKKGM